MTPAADKSNLTSNRAEFVRVQLEATRTPIEKAAQRGELRPGIALDVALDLALGPIYVRTPITGQPIADKFTAEFVDLLLRGVAASCDQART